MSAVPGRVDARRGLVVAALLAVAQVVGWTAATAAGLDLGSGPLSAAVAATAAATALAAATIARPEATADDLLGSVAWALAMVLPLAIVAAEPWLAPDSKAAAGLALVLGLALAAAPWPPAWPLGALLVLRAAAVLASPALLVAFALVAVVAAARRRAPLAALALAVAVAQLGAPGTAAALALATGAVLSRVGGRRWAVVALVPGLVVLAQVLESRALGLPWVAMALGGVAVAAAAAAAVPAVPGEDEPALAVAELPALAMVAAFAVHPTVFAYVGPAGLGAYTTGMVRFVGAAALAGAILLVARAVRPVSPT